MLWRNGLRLGGEDDAVAFQVDAARVAQHHQRVIHSGALEVAVEEPLHGH